MHNFSDRLARAGRTSVPIVLLALLPIAFFAPVIFTGGNWGREAFALRWPIAYYAAQSWRVGDIPLWNPYFFGGTPFLAHPEANALYPLVLLFAFLPPDWAMQIYAVIPFSMSAVFTYLLARRLGLSSTASGLSAVVYTFHFARLAPLGHVQLQHTAAWLPLLLFALETLLQSGPKWARCAALLAIVLALQGLGMHAQVFAYGLFLLTLYAVARLWQLRSGGPVAAMRVALSSGAGILALGVLLLPVLEFLPLSSRSSLDYPAFTLFAFKPSDLIQLVHPFLQALPLDPGWTVEARLYFGTAPLLLAALGVVSRKPRTLILSLLLAIALLLSTVTALTPVLYKVPLLNLFRVQSRWMVPGALFFALLAASGLDRLRESPSKRMRASLLIGAGILLALFLWTARERVVLLFVPLLIGAVSVYLVLRLAGGSAAFRPQLQLLALVLVELWYVFQPPKANPMPLPQTIRIQKGMAGLLSAQGGVDRVWKQCYSSDDVSNENLYGPWPLVTSYNPWMVRTLQDLTGFDGSCALFQDFWRRETNLVPELLRVGTIQLPASVWNGAPATPCIASGEEPCFDPGYAIVLAPGEHLTFDLGQTAVLDELALSTYLTNATKLGQGERAAEVALEGEGGSQSTMPILAGIHTAEWSYDCPGAEGSMQHARPLATTQWKSGDCTGNYWFGLLDLPAPFRATSVTLHNLTQDSTLVIDAASVRSTEGVWSALSIQHAQARRDFGGLEEIPSPDPRWVLLRRSTALPYAWAVERVEAMGAESLAASLRGDGARLAVESVAYLADGEAATPQGPSIIPGRFDRLAEVTLVEHGANEIRLAVSSQGPSFVVLSEVFYPGWKAWVDDTEVPLFRADYILQGLQVPSGAHQVRLGFRPASVYGGFGLSLAGGIIILGMVSWDLWSLSRRKGKIASRQESGR
jgi:hypothetical protein